MTIAQNDPALSMTLEWHERQAWLALGGTCGHDAEIRLAEVGEVLVAQGVSALTVDLTDVWPYASPSCLRALLHLRARLRRAGVPVTVQRRFVHPASGERESDRLSNNVVRPVF